MKEDVLYLLQTLTSVMDDFNNRIAEVERRFDIYTFNSMDASTDLKEAAKTIEKLIAQVETEEEDLLKTDEEKIESEERKKGISKRNQEIYKISQNGFDVKTISKLYNLSPATIQSIVAKEKAKEEIQR
ncbi:hypothetical protein ABEY43_06655 [Priestia megaterium]